MPDEPSDESPYRAMRRVQSDRFDQVTYERHIASEEREACCLGYGPSVDDPRDFSWSEKCMAKERVLLLDQEQRLNRRVIDRSALIVSCHFLTLSPRSR